MARLGTPYPILYLAKNAKTGLTTITAKVLKQDLSVFANLTLVEIAEAGFEGTYTANIFTSATTDSEGEYLLVINEPNGHKAVKSITFEAAPADPSGDIGINRKSVVEADIVKNEALEAFVSINRFNAYLGTQDYEAYFYKDDLEYFLDNNEYIGELP